MTADEPVGGTRPAAAGPDSVADAAGEHRAALTRGVQWTAAAQSLRVVLQFGVAIVLARLLAPADFGLLAMASAIIAVVSAVQTLGTHGPLIQRDQLAPVLIDTVFVLNLVLAIGLAAGIYFAAPLLAAMYRSEAVQPLIEVTSFALVLYAFSGVPGSLLRRHLRFGAVAASATLGAVLHAAFAVVLAWLGYGAWSLVIALLVASAGEAIFLLIAARYRPRLRFSWVELRSIAGFSANMTGVNILHLVLQNADSFIIGRWLGAGALGMYGMATRFTRQPVDIFVGSVLGPVLFPAYSRMQRDDELTARTMRRVLAGAAFVMFPLLGGLAAIVRPFVEGVLGPQWSPAIALIALMVPIGMARTMLSTANAIFMARNRTRLFLGLRLGGGFVLIGAYLAGVQIGLVAVVAALLLAEIAITAVELAICARLTGSRLSALVAGARGPLLATLAMAGVVHAVERLLFAQGWNDLLILALAVPLGVAVYGGLALCLRMAALVDLIDLLPARFGAPLRRVVRFA